MVMASSDTMLCSLSAYTPAAFTTTLASTSPRVVDSFQPPSVFSMPVTSVSNWNFTPLRAAFSARAKVSPKGHTIAPVGAYRAATAWSLMLGSIWTSSSRSTMRRPSTPLATPFSYSLFRAGRSSSLTMTTRLPLFS